MTLQPCVADGFGHGTSDTGHRPKSDTGHGPKSDTGHEPNNDTGTFVCFAQRVCVYICWSRRGQVMSIVCTYAGRDVGRNLRFDLIRFDSIILMRFDYFDSLVETWTEIKGFMYRHCIVCGLYPVPARD